MSCQDEVMKIGKKLEKMVSSGTSDHGTALELLNTLQKQKMTLDVLQKTRIGMTVNNFRKSSKEEEVISLAKSLIKTWKKLLSGDSSSQSSNSSSSVSRSNSVLSTASSKDDETSQDGQKDSMETAGEEASPEQPDKEKQEKSNDTPKQTLFQPQASETTDGIRIKCREMLTNALKTEPQPDEVIGDHANIAAQIEDAIYGEMKNTEMKYKNRVRSRVANLRDSKNPQLRGNVLRGYIAPSKVACMTAEEMANDEMKKMREKYTKEAIEDHQMSMTSGTTTDLLKCGKCGKRNVSYNQVQTRSADEPMTTFCLCNECGNRWKFC